MDNYLIAKATDVGIARQVNEDSMTVFTSQNGQVMAVCDGMGGQAAGDVASQLAVNIIENILTDNKFETPEEAIKRSVLAANQGVLNRAAQTPDLEGMGSTCVMLIIKDGRVHCGWVGDSRIYYISNHTIRQISHDQSYVQQLVDSGQITPAEAAQHPQKNEITNCIGLSGMTEPEIIAVPIVPEPGSVFLLCSDGLSGMVDERQIERVVSNDKMSLQQKADRLIAMANEAGGLDNITVELVQFGTSQSSGATSGTLFEAPSGVKNGKKKSHVIIYSVIAAIVLAIVAVVGVKFYLDNKKEKNEVIEKVKSDKKQSQQPKSKKTSEPPKPIDTQSTVPVAPKAKVQNQAKKNRDKSTTGKKVGDAIKENSESTSPQEEKSTLTPKQEQELQDLKNEIENKRQ